MPELTPSTREAARRIGVTETALRKAEGNGGVVREADGQWDIDRPLRRLALVSCRYHVFAFGLEPRKACDA